MEATGAAPANVTDANIGMLIRLAAAIPEVSMAECFRKVRRLSSCIPLILLIIFKNVLNLRPAIKEKVKPSKIGIMFFTFFRQQN